MEHERLLYSERERMTEQEIDALFEEYYSDRKVFGCESPLTEDQIAAIERVRRHRLGN